MQERAQQPQDCAGRHLAQIGAQQAQPTSRETHLRRHKVGSVARRHEKPVVCPQLLGKAKVANADGLGVAGLVNVEDVAGFQVSVDHLEGKGGGPGLQVTAPGAIC